jgi:uncharacterized protein YcbK (DUF882 family)
MSSLPSGVSKGSRVVLTPAISAFVADLRANLPSSVPMYLTSGYRDPSDQARAMGEKIRLGESLAKLYPSDMARDVTAAYPDQSRMAAVIAGYAARGKGSRHLAGLAVDLRSRNLTSAQIQQVLSTAQRLGATQAIYETTPAHIHIGIPDGYRGAAGTSVARSGRSRVSTGRNRRSSGSGELAWTAGATVAALAVVATVAALYKGKDKRGMR